MPWTSLTTQQQAFVQKYLGFTPAPSPEQEELARLWEAHKAQVMEFAAIYIKDLAEAPSYDEIKARVEEAQKIEAGIKDALASFDPAVINPMVAALEDWASKGPTDALLGRAKAEIKKLLSDEYGGWKGWHEDQVAIDLTKYLDADKSKLEPLLNTVKADVAKMKAGLAGDDTAEHLRLLADLLAIEGRGDALEAARIAAEKNMVSKELEDSGVGGAHRAAVTELSQSDPESFEVVGDILDETTAILGGEEATAEFIDTQEAKAAVLAQTVDAAYLLYGPAQKEMDEQQAELALLKAKEVKLLKQIADAGSKVPKGLQDQLSDVQRDIGIKNAVVAALELPLGPLKAAYDLAKGEFDETTKVIAAAEKQKLVLDAVSFGPLSPDYGKPVDDSVRKDLLKVIEQNTKLGATAVELAGTAEHPESLAQTALVVVDRVEDNFMDKNGVAYSNDGYAEDYAENLMKMSASVPADQMADLDAYLENGRQFESIPELSGDTFEEDTKGRTGHVANCMLKDGAMDIGKGKDALKDVLFHPDSVAYPTPELANHMLGTFEYLEGSEDARDTITEMKKPTNPGGQALVKASSGNDAGTQSNDDAGRALLNAMMTPVYQGKVGSCFATSSIVRMREENPDMALETFEHMIKTGNYKPVNGREVPVIQNVPSDENPLVRSLEYSAATATARDADSIERDNLETRTGKGVDTLASKFKPVNWAVLQSKIDTILSDSFTFTYDPEQKVTLAGDGNSDKGRYVLMRKDNMTPVNDKVAFIATIKDKVMAEIKDDDLMAGVTKDDVEAMIDDDKFVEAMQFTKKEDGRDVKKFPWELSSGGFTDAAAKTIMGATGNTNGFLDELADDEDLDEGPRTKEILSGFLDTFGEDVGQMSTMRTVGQHGFNGLPNHPSLDALKEGGKEKFDENLEREVIDKGTELKNTVIDADRAGFMFDQEMKELLERADEDLKEKLEQGISAHRPRVDMKPAEFEKAIKDATADYHNEVAKKKLEAYKKSFTDDGKPEPDEDACNEKLAAYKKSLEEDVDNIATNRLMKDLGAPEFVIADTNWGGGTDHTYFVIVPDPTTGEPKMMQRVDPPGTLSYPGDEWLRKKWAKID